MSKIVIKLQEMELNANQNILSTIVVVYINSLKTTFCSSIYKFGLSVCLFIYIL